MNNESHNIIGLILAGGEGRRLGGLDKGLQEYKGRPLIEYVIDALKQQTDNIVISVNRNEDAYKQYGLQLINDIEDSFQGPLAGLVAAIPTIKEYQKEYLLLASCDAPYLPVDYAVTLKRALANSKAVAAVVHDGKRSQNMHCLLRCDALTSSKSITSIQHFYQNGGRALYRWFEKNEVIEVDFSAQAKSFLNINTLKQLKA